MKKPILVITAAIFILTYYLNIYAQASDTKLPSPDINSPSYILIEPATGQVLVEKSPDEIRYPASTTKIMTAVLAIEMGKLDQEMVASAQAIADIGDGGSNIGIMAGEVLTLEQLLKALLISSANESANIIAENICSYSSNPRKEFVNLMNKRARELGAANTHFTNTCGIHDPEHYTTVSDMAKIARHAMNLPAFRGIVDSTGYSLPSTNKHEAWDSLMVTNKYLNPFYSGQYKPENFKITGVKTGFTTPAGNCLVTTAVNDEGEELLAVVYGVTSVDSSNNIYAYTNKLLEWGFSSYSKQKVVSSGETVKNVRFKGAKNNSTGLITASSFQALLPINKNEWQIEEKINWINKFEAPAKKGAKMGYIEYFTNGVSLGKVNIITDSSVELKFYLKAASLIKNLFKGIFSRKFLAFILITSILFIFLRICLRHISRTIKANRQQN